MSLLVLRDNLAYPLVSLILVAGFYLTIKIRFFQFKYPLLSLKVVTGSMDWKGTKGQIVPSQAFSAGTAGSLIVGSAIGAWAGFDLYGPGILLWIWISSLFAMPFWYLSSTLSLRYRQRLESGAVLAGPPLYIDGALRARWLSLLVSFLIVSVALLQGGAFPLSVLSESLRHTTVPLPPLSLSLGLGIVLMLLFLGGVRRVAWSARRLLFPALLLLIPVLFALFRTLAHMGAARMDLPEGSAGFFSAAVAGFLPQNGEELRRLIVGLALFHVFAETGSGRLAILSGAVRTDHPAKQGIAAMLAPLLQAFGTATLALFVLFSFQSFAGSEKDNITYFLFSGTALSPWMHGFLLLSLAAITVATMTSWFYAGSQAAFHLGGRSMSYLFRILYLAVLFATGFHLQTAYGKPPVEIYEVTAMVGMFAALFLLAVLILLHAPGRFELRRFLESKDLRREPLQDLMLLLMVLLPKNLISRIFGELSRLRLPRFLMVPVLRAFASAYRINLEEAEYGIETYPSLNRFFTRGLREGVRPVDPRAGVVVSPVDGRLSQFGDIVDGRLIQAKGIEYTLEDLLDWDRFLDRYQNGRYAVIYLSPQDYHRIHSPYGGRVLGYTYSPGKLFAVNKLAVKGIAGLFPKNERLTTYLETPAGHIAVIKVGATNVGRIRVTYDPVCTNRWIRVPRNLLYEKELSPLMQKGQELGRFEMGSTVVLLFEKGTFEFRNDLHETRKLRMGEPIGSLLLVKTAAKKSSKKTVKKSSNAGSQKHQRK